MNGLKWCLLWYCITGQWEPTSINFRNATQCCTLMPLKFLVNQIKNSSLCSRCYLFTQSWATAKNSVISYITWTHTWLDLRSPYLTWSRKSSNIRWANCGFVSCLQQAEKYKTSEHTSKYNCPAETVRSERKGPMACCNTHLALLPHSMLSRSLRGNTCSVPTEIPKHQTQNKVSGKVTTKSWTFHPMHSQLCVIIIEASQTRMSCVDGNLYNMRKTYKN